MGMGVSGSKMQRQGNRGDPKLCSLLPRKLVMEGEKHQLVGVYGGAQADMGRDQRDVEGNRRY